jgi:hypothetical protein
MLPTPTILMLIIGGLVLLSVVVLVSTGSVLSLLVVWSIAAIVIALLYNFGVLKFSTSDKGIEIDFMEKAVAPTPTPTKSLVPMTLSLKEVFYVEGNDYTYEEAPAVCAAYDADLASYDQIVEAHSKGAEWCGYGWTQGGMALFPTQQGTWESLQMEASVANKTACGRPGVNGGYFDPKTKFGVNCYGLKPENTGIKLPQPLPGIDTSAFQTMVNRFKSMLSKMQVSPFNRTEWSGILTPNLINK